MRALPSLSGWLSGLSRRERLFVAGGAAISAAALLFTLGGGPLLDRWSAREERIAADRERWVRLHDLVSSEPRLRRAVAEGRRAHAATTRRLLVGPTPALAASHLQALLQQYAEESLVQLNRVDVAGRPTAERPGLLAVPVMLQGQGDVYGLVDFLHRVQHGPRLLVIDDIAINTRSSWLEGDQTLLWSLRAHGLYPDAEGSS